MLNFITDYLTFTRKNGEKFKDLAFVNTEKLKSEINNNEKALQLYMKCFDKKNVDIWLRSRNIKKYVS